MCTLRQAYKQQFIFYSGHYILYNKQWGGGAGNRGNRNGKKENKGTKQELCLVKTSDNAPSTDKLR